VVLSPDSQELLNPQAETVSDSAKNFGRTGYFAYAQVETDDFLRMLQVALSQERNRESAEQTLQ
jgi:hypothetical protein